MLITAKSPNAKVNVHPISSRDIAQLWDNTLQRVEIVSQHHSHNRIKQKKMHTLDKNLVATDHEVAPPKRLKIGFISSDFGVHPIATLIRGLIQYIDPVLVELYCFAVNDKVSPM